MGQGFAAQPCGLVEQQGVAYAKTVAEAMNLKLDMDHPADREKLRRASTSAPTHPVREFLYLPSSFPQSAAKA